jgi:hypothetical protein
MHLKKNNGTKENGGTKDNESYKRLFKNRGNNKRPNEVS